MLRFAGPQIVVVASLLLFGAFPRQLLFAADGAAVKPAEPQPPYILVGFVGGFVRHNNPHHGPVVLAKNMQRFSPTNSFIQVFENRHRKSAYKAILRQLDTNHDRILSRAEKSHARIILFGQSWGASAVVLLARDLDRAGIPVLLTVQVDSIAKPWQDDDLIPDNVSQAANFYQPHGLLHGQKIIRAVDASKTKILGNYRFDYKVSPVKCEGMSWIDRKITPDHMQSECDPHLWSQVESLVRQRLEPEPDKFASMPRP